MALLGKKYCEKNGEKTVFRGSVRREDWRVSERNMKRIFCLLLILAAMVLAGCTADPGTIPVESEDVLYETGESLAQRLVGSYCGPVSAETGEPDIFLEISYFGGYLIAEAKETYAAYWAMELTPTNETALYSTAADSLEVQAAWFSGFSNNGAYWPQTELYTLQLTESGVDFISADGSVQSYIRDDTLEKQHDSEQYREMLAAEDGAVYPDRLIGTWCGETADGSEVFLAVGGDGAIQCLYRHEGDPIRVHTGRAVWNADRTVLTLLTERVGWGRMPWFDTVSVDCTAEQCVLRTQQDCGILPGETDVVLTKTENCVSAQ